MNAAHGKTIQIRLRCGGEEALIRLLSQLKVVELLAMFYEYGSSKQLLGNACDAVLILGSKDEK
jgi:hypothetical protein